MPVTYAVGSNATCPRWPAPTAADAAAQVFYLPGGGLARGTAVAATWGGGAARTAEEAARAGADLRRAAAARAAASRAQGGGAGRLG